MPALLAANLTRQVEQLEKMLEDERLRTREAYEFSWAAALQESAASRDGPEGAAVADDRLLAEASQMQMEVAESREQLSSLNEELGQRDEAMASVRAELEEAQARRDEADLEVAQVRRELEQAVENLRVSEEQNAAIVADKEAAKEAAAEEAVALRAALNGVISKRR